MMAQADWTQVLIAYGNARNWKPLATRRALRKFADETGLDVSGFAADRAFRLGYNALMIATPEERAACTDWQSVKDLMARQEQSRVASIKAKEQATEQLIASLAKRRIWTINGLYMEDESISRYTLDEIKAWVDWATGRYIYREPSVYAQTQHEGQTLSVNFSGHFRDMCGNRCPATENMTELAADLAAFTDERRASDSKWN